VVLYYWKWQRNAPAAVLDETMHEDDGGFGVWDRVDASIELGVSVGYPLFSVLFHVEVRMRTKGVPSLIIIYPTSNMNTLPVTYYPKSEYIETVVFLTSL
jgi:hypothetical protein